MEEIQFSVMLKGAKVIKDDEHSITWKTHVQLASREVTVAYVKRIPIRKVFIESVCATLGRALGLPIPPPILVLISHEVLPEMVPKEQNWLAFGSKDTDLFSIKRYVHDDRVWERLKDFPQLLDLGCFDEWIGNPDRHQGNILFDGKDKFSFIDHDKAIDKKLGCHCAAESNQLLEFMATGLSEFEKHKLNHQALGNFVPSCEKLPMEVLCERVCACEYLDEKEVVDTVQFLQSRIQAFEQLFRERICIQQQAFAL